MYDSNELLRISLRNIKIYWQRLSASVASQNFRAEVEVKKEKSSLTLCCNLIFKQFLCADIPYVILNSQFSLFFICTGSHLVSAIYSKPTKQLIFIYRCIYYLVLVYPRDAKIAVCLTVILLLMQNAHVAASMPHFFLIALSSYTISVCVSWKITNTARCF